MTKCFPMTHLLLATIIFALPLSAGVSLKADTGKRNVSSSTPYLTRSAVTIAKASEPLNNTALAFLKSRNSEKAKFWVFFTDKGHNAGELLRATPQNYPAVKKSLTRRAKVGQNDLLFVDIPASDTYLRQISELGAKSDGVSRWLNAAVFESDYTVLTQIAALPFVAEIRPMAIFTRPLGPVEELSATADANSPSDAQVLNYGASLTQLQQIKANIAHSLGYTGAGVTVAMLDTGYRKTHNAFAAAYAEGRVLAEYDFINNDFNTANEGADASNQWSHGTLTWSTLGGAQSGAVYGPAYGANFLLAKTENVPVEIQQEEIDWVRALEWADSFGADVISSSLGYSDWYTYANFDGATAVTTIGANTAAGLGIVVCNSMGNGGPGPGTLTAPADAFNILSCGAVSSSGLIASFSSRGPTFDGRTKPEICAQGVSTVCATSTNNTSVGTASGTSLSTPLIGGIVAQLIEAHPNWPPELVIEALRETGSTNASPDNNYGWGIANVEQALNYGANFTATPRVVDFPQLVQFTDSSSLPVLSSLWNFGDASTSTALSPSHSYALPGVYSVSLTIQTTAYGAVARTKAQYIVQMADTIKFGQDSAYAGQTVVIPVSLTNFATLGKIQIPIDYAMPLNVTFDSALAGARTAAFESVTISDHDDFAKQAVVELVADTGAGGPGTPLPSGAGEVARLFFTINPLEIGGQSGALDTTTLAGKSLQVTSGATPYSPHHTAGLLGAKGVTRGDSDNNTEINIGDTVYLISFIFLSGPAPVSTQSGDADSSGGLNIGDAVFLIAYIFLGGPAPAIP